MPGEVSGEPVFTGHVAGLPHGHVLIAGAYYVSLVEGSLGEGAVRKNEETYKERWKESSSHEFNRKVRCG